MFYLQNNLLPPLLLSLPVTNSQIHRYGTGIALDLELPSCISHSFVMSS